MHDERLKFSYRGKALIPLEETSPARYYRLLCRIRIQDAATVSGLSTRSISEFERGKRSLPPESAERLRLAIEQLDAARQKSERRKAGAAKAALNHKRGEPMNPRLRAFLIIVSVASSTVLLGQATDTPTDTPTNTPTNTPTVTATVSPSQTPRWPRTTPTVTRVNTRTAVPTRTRTPTRTHTATRTPTRTPTITPTYCGLSCTATQTPAFGRPPNTPTRVPTRTPTVTPS